jgi:hypothetical protein
MPAAMGCAQKRIAHIALLKKFSVHAATVTRLKIISPGMNYVFGDTAFAFSFVLFLNVKKLISMR